MEQQRIPTEKEIVEAFKTIGAYLANYKSIYDDKANYAFKKGFEQEGNAYIKKWEVAQKLHWKLAQIRRWYDEVK